MSRQGTGISRNDWLETGQTILKKQGVVAVKLKALTTLLNVTTGSFYHHFNDFGDYLEQLANYYAEEQIERYIVEALAQSNEEPLSRLIEMSRIASQAGGRELSIAMRSWARDSTIAAKAVKKLDLIILDYCNDVFLDMGFQKDEAAVRSLIALAVSVADIDYKIMDRPVGQLLPQIHQVLTNPPSPIGGLTPSPDTNETVFRVHEKSSPR